MRTILVALALLGLLIGSQSGRAGSVRPLPAPDAVVRTPRAVPLLAADGHRVAFETSERFGQNIERRVEIWSGGRPAPVAVARTRNFEAAFVGIDGLALAGTRVAWTDWSEGNLRDQEIFVTDLHGDSRLRAPDRYEWNVLDHTQLFSSGPDRGGTFIGALHGAGDLIVANTWAQCELYGDSGEKDPSCTPASPTWIDQQTIAAIAGKKLQAVYAGEDALRVADVDGAHIVVRETAGPVTIRTARGTVLRKLDFPRGTVVGAQLAGTTVVVLTGSRLQAYGLDGRSGGSCPLGPGSGRVLAGAARGVAAIVEGRRVLRVVRLSDCAQLRLAPPGASVGAADITGAGLFYAVNRGGGSVAFIRFGRLFQTAW